MEKTLKNPNLRTRAPFSATDQPKGAGRKKGSLSLTNLAKKALQEHNSEKAKGFVKSWINNAIEGKPAPFNALLDRIDGIQSPNLGLDDRPILVIMPKAKKDPE